MIFSKQFPAVTFLAGALLLGFPALAAEEPDEVEGEIVFGPQYYVDSDNPDSAKFEEYRDVPNGFTAEHFLFSWTPRERTYFRLDAVDVGQEDQRLVFEAGQVDLWRAGIRWAENPRRWTDQAVMLFSNNEDGLFTLEDSFQSAVRAGAASTLPGGDANLDGKWDAGTKGYIIENAILSSGSSVALEHHRKQGGVMLEATPTAHWIFGMTADRERRTGTTPQNLGMYFSLAPAEVAAPVDFRTDTVGTTAEYRTRRFDLGVQLLISTFEADHQSLTWDNQLFLVDEAVNANAANPARGRMTFVTDNELERVAIRGGVNLPAHTRLDASYALTTTTQDDSFLPMTINSLLTPGALPAASLDGEYRTQSAQLRLASRPTQALRWNAWWRSYEMDNRSPSLTFVDQVITDFQFGLCANPNLPCDANGNNVLDDRIPRRNLPYGYHRESTGGLVGWRPTSWFDGALGYEREEMTREFSAVEDSTEDAYKLNLDFDPAAWLGIRTTLRRQERRADEYHAHYLEQAFPNGEPIEAAFNEGMRRYYWTDRDRDSWAVQVDVTPAEHWSLYAEASQYDDDYFDPETGRPIGESYTIQEDRNFDTVLETYDILLAGRTENKGRAISLGVAYDTGPKFDLYADYTVEDSEYALASRYRNVVAGVGTDDPLDNWTSGAEDDYDTANLGFRWALSADRLWTLRGDLSRSKGTSLITTDFVPGGAASGNTTLTAFPEVETTLEIATLVLNRAARKNLDYSLRYWYESWREDNFASDFNEPYMGDPGSDPSMANAVFLGIDYGDYTNHLVSFMMRYEY